MELHSPVCEYRPSEKSATLQVENVPKCIWTKRTQRNITTHRYINKSSPWNRPRKFRGGVQAWLNFFNLGAGWRWVVDATLRPLYPRERCGTHCTWGWVGPRTGLDACGKSRPRPGFDPRTVQPVASRYTDWAIPATARQRCPVLIVTGMKGKASSTTH
jgi:hypothetical protein